MENNELNTNTNEQTNQPVEPVMPTEPVVTSEPTVQPVQQPVQAASVQPVQEQVQASPVQPVQEQVQATPVQPTQEPKKGKSNNMVLIILLIIILLAGAGASYYFLIYKQTKDKGGVTTTTTTTEATTTTATVADDEYEKKYQGTDFDVYAFDLKNENTCTENIYAKVSAQEDEKYVIIIKNVKIKGESYTVRFENIPPADLNTGSVVGKYYLNDKVISTEEGSPMAGLGKLCAYDNYMVAYSAWEGLPTYKFYNSEGQEVLKFKGYEDKYNNGIFTIKEYKNVNADKTKATEVISELDMKSDKLERKNSTEKEYTCAENDPACN